MCTLGCADMADEFLREEWDYLPEDDKNRWAGENEYARYNYLTKFFEIKVMLGCTAASWSGHHLTYKY
jgi:hypothetical protein